MRELVGHVTSTLDPPQNGRLKDYEKYVYPGRNVVIGSDVFFIDDSLIINDGDPVIVTHKCISCIRGYNNREFFIVIIPSGITSVWTEDVKLHPFEKIDSQLCL